MEDYQKPHHSILFRCTEFLWLYLWRPKIFKRYLKHCSVLLLLFMTIGSLLTYKSVTHLHSKFEELQFLSSIKPLDGAKQCTKTYAIYGKRPDSGYLKHVHSVFKKLGYCRVYMNETSNWSVLWAHNYPFRVLADKLSQMTQGQKINHFPGSGFITNKMNLATSGLNYVPKAFQLPKDVKKFKEYANTYPTKLFVQKSNNHRGIKIEPIERLDLSNNASFVQEFIHNPLLINGHKFDIGVYTVITSIDPLRVYMYKEVLYRFCPEPYHPFDATKVDKYVVGDDYSPIWQIDSLKGYYTEQGLGMRDSFDAWYNKVKKDPSASGAIWAQVESAIRTMLLNKETSLSQAQNRFLQNSNHPDPNKFFELMRFDFIIDEEGQVYLMEANMSPNLSSAHFAPNALLYEHVVLNTLSVTGLASPFKSGEEARDENLISRKEISLVGEHCKTSLCSGTKSCNLTKCSVCSQCLDKEKMTMFKKAYWEHVHRLDTVRIFPPRELPKVLKGESLLRYDSTGLNENNRVLVQWFKSKCMMDSSFCM